MRTLRMSVMVLWPWLRLWLHMAQDSSRLPVKARARAKGRDNGRAKGRDKDRVQGSVLVRNC